MNRFNKDFWNDRYQSMQIGWDTGGPTTPFVELFKTIEDKSLSILIPGCGYGHEGEHLFNLGFTNVTLLDVSPLARKEFLQRVPNFPADQFVNDDFFSHQGVYDLILEQTFFCALEPSLRQKYALKMFDLLKPEGKVQGVLFTFPKTKKGPPFGGSVSEYNELFSPLFELRNFELCYNSIKPRKENELFIDLKKRN